MPMHAHMVHAWTPAAQLLANKGPLKLQMKNFASRNEVRRFTAPVIGEVCNVEAHHHRNLPMIPCSEIPGTAETLAHHTP